ncbi:LLM class flavin-dependent oxidoreductase [Nonomuraea sp. B10E15]|uniref:LLM class flavin-dependent oxidoreductase n=1 Tax=Nonomuraea sp. B10E15 TaxID=3153560 RepID=UPI00325F38D4
MPTSPGSKGGLLRTANAAPLISLDGPCTTGPDGDSSDGRHPCPTEWGGSRSAWKFNRSAGKQAAALAAAATVTDKIGLEFGVLSLPLRPTAWIAAQIQTLQHLSGNRVTLGVGIGGFPGSPFWRAVGAPLQGRGRRADEALQALPGLIRGEATPLGEEDITLGPAAPVPPVLVGGNSEAAMHRAVRHGDGWAPSLISPAALAEKVVRLREIARELGRPVPSIAVGGHAILVGNAAAVESFTRDLVDVHGMTPEEAQAIPVTGSPAQVVERLHAYSEAGADMVGVSLDCGDWTRQAEALAEARAQLSHRPLTSNGDLSGIREAAERFSAAGPAPVHLRMDPQVAVPAETAVLAYRIVSEGLTNVRRHAPQASRVDLGISAGEGLLEIMMTNDGVTRARSGRRGGSGLPGLTALVQAQGGELVTRAVPDGWSLTARLPSA